MMLMTSGAESEVPAHSMYKKVFNSYFATVSYSYDDRYYVDLAGRRDGSSLFAKNNQWANFYSVGAHVEHEKGNFPAKRVVAGCPAIEDKLRHDG